jgi:hypothetical protein
MTTLQGKGSIPGRGQEMYIQSAMTGREGHPAYVQWVPVAPSPRVKISRRDADHSTVTSPNVKKERSYTSAAPASVYT